MGSNGFPVIARRYTHHVLERPIEGIVIRISDFLADLLNGFICFEHELLGLLYTVTNQKIHELLANFVLEQLA